MQHYWSLNPVDLENVWLTIGSFDGVHLGHQSILRQIVLSARSEGNPSVVLSFHPHPGVVLGKRSGAFYLTTPEEKASLLSRMGVDYLITHPFNQKVAGLSAQEFIYHLYESLKFRWLCVGSDFALGRGREGNLDVLEGIGKTLGYEVKPLSPLKIEGKVISSSWVRQALNEADLKTVTRLLGRPYQVTGEVVHGDGRGKMLGFPTANLEVWSERALPKSGVYAGWAQVDGEIIPAVTNIGFRPTFDHHSERPHIEAHLIDFDRNLYHRQVSLSFITFLRDEKRFENIASLISQVHRDIEEARSILKVSSYETIPGAT